MNIHEFGTENKETVVLVHPSLVMWDYFEYVIPLMKDRYHLVIPALSGYDKDNKSDFTSIEEIAGELGDWLITNNCKRIANIYGCSMGGSIVLRFLSEGRVQIDSAIIDGGITPYDLNWIATRFIALKDFLMICLGKAGGLRFLERAFHTDDYSEEELKYVADILKMISVKTIWRTFDSCNNFDIISPSEITCKHIEYWYTELEEKARRQDIDYVKENIPRTVFKIFNGVGHAGIAILHSELFVSAVEDLINRALGPRRI